MAKRGRPRKKAAEKKGDRLYLRAENAEKQAFEAAARLSGIPFSTWARLRLRDAAAAELGKFDQKIAFLPKA